MIFHVGELGISKTSHLLRHILWALGRYLATQPRYLATPAMPSPVTWQPQESSRTFGQTSINLLQCKTAATV